MPSLPEREKRLDSVLYDWYHTVNIEVDMIVGWRADPARFWKKHGEPLSPQFKANTIYILSETSRRFPKLDTQAVQNIYRVIIAWHEDKCHKRIPDDTTLNEWIDELHIITNTLSDAITDAQFKKDKRGRPKGTTIKHNDELVIELIECGRIKKRGTKWKQAYADIYERLNPKVGLEGFRSKARGWLKKLGSGRSK